MAARTDGLLRGFGWRLEQGARLLLATLALAVLPPAAAAGPNPSSAPPDSDTAPAESRYAEALDVSLVTLVVRVVDTWGHPILGLTPEDFRVRLGGEPIEVVALDWVGVEEDEVAATSSATAATLPSAPDDHSAPEDRDRNGAGANRDEHGTRSDDGRLVVVFVQADLHPSRISGQMRLRPFTRELFHALHPGDRVAVVSFDSHLKMWQDFVADPVATHAAIDRAMLYSREAPVDPSEPHSLARRLDRRAARDAASPERALELVGDAMTPLPGEKMLLYLGWGLGRFGRDGVRMTPDYAPAVRALRAARAAVFVLDVTSADEHSLSMGLEGVAADTGGMYLSTFRLPQLATRTLGRALAGHYVLSLDRAQLQELDQRRLRVELRSRRGTVLTRPLTLR